MITEALAMNSHERKRWKLNCEEKSTGRDWAHSVVANVKGFKTMTSAPRPLLIVASVKCFVLLDRDIVMPI